MSASEETSDQSKREPDRELGRSFMPKFDSSGLLSAVAQDAATGEILMLAFMDAAALAKTRSTGLAHFYSRSRQRLWLKGETSGNTLEVIDILVDCDQDALILQVRPNGPACHTNARSCFYRKLHADGLIAADQGADQAYSDGKKPGTDK